MPSVPELCERFDTRNKCVTFLEHLRWPDGPECPRCGSKKVYPTRTPPSEVAGGLTDHRFLMSGPDLAPSNLPTRGGESDF